MKRFLKRVLKTGFCFLFLMGFLTAEAAADDLSDGIAYYQAGEYTKAFGVVKRFAERGDTDARYLLGYMYQTGKGIDVDEVIAGKWFSKAADEGHSLAQYEMAQYYYQGKGDFERNPSEAFVWFERAAAQNHAKAQLMLGHCYLKGIGVAANRDTALVWYTRAARQGNEEAARQLMHFYPDTHE